MSTTATVNLAKEHLPPLRKLRASYLAEVERLARELRPRFQKRGDLAALWLAEALAAEYLAYSRGEGNSAPWRRKPPSSLMMAGDRLESIARRRFGLVPDTAASRASALVVLIASPSHARGDVDDNGRPAR